MRLSYEFVNVLGAVYHRGSIKFGPDGGNVFSPAGNKVIVYDLKASRSNALPFQVNYNIELLSIHPRNTIMLAASEKSHLYIISLVSGKMLHMKDYKSFAKITHLSFSPCGRYYCVCGENLVLIYITPGSMIAGKGREITPFRLMKKYRVNHDIVMDVSWTSDSKYICIANQDISLTILPLTEIDKNSIQLKGHNDTILRCYFANRYEGDRLLYSLTKNCHLITWDEVSRDIETLGSEQKRAKASFQMYKTAKHYLRLDIDPNDSQIEKNRKINAYIESSDYSSTAMLLVVGYNTGHYSLYEMPSATLIYDLDSNSGKITSISINRTGDWIAFGSSVDPEANLTEGHNKTMSRLFVWEWQSKSHVLDQTGSGATMSNMHECVSYSLDGTHIVSGNMAGQIKVWSGLTGETVACFGHEHVGPIKAIKFAPNKSGKVIISASLDGTLRAYDLNKYKNFKSFHSPVEDKSPEFICLDIDSTGEFIAAGTYNYFEIYLYSLQTGKFLEYLTGHEGPVSSVIFSPISNLLVSASWDHTVRIWNLFEGSKCIRDTIFFQQEVITASFRPDGNQFAISLSNGQIVIFNPHTAEQMGAPIEGTGDLGTTQLMTDVSRDEKKFFLTLNYSADGTYIIAGGNSNFICIYHSNEKILVKKFAMTFNMSLDGIFDYVSNRRRKEFGYNLELIEQRKEERAQKPIRLPGVHKGDLGDRQAKPVIATCQVVFSPTMRSFAAATTEGVLIYSLDVSRHFDPYRLSINVDPSSVSEALERQDYGVALIQSLQLNDKNLFLQVLESIPLDMTHSIINSLDMDYVNRTLLLISSNLPNTKHIEYYLLWIKGLLYKHGMTMKTHDAREVTPLVRALHQNLQRDFMNIKRNSEYCKYSLEYLTETIKGDIGLGLVGVASSSGIDLDQDAGNETMQE